jgi:hypothetical protein
MLRIRADHAHHAFAVDHLALVAHLFYGRSNLHNPYFQLLATNHSPLLQQLGLSEQLYNPAARAVMRGKLHSHSIARPQSFEIPDARAGRVRNH